MKSFESIREYVLVGVASLAIVTIMFLHTPLFVQGHPDFEKPWDHHKYIYMAEKGPFSLHVAPFCWRVGAPILVRLLPFEAKTGFLVVTLAAITATGISSYILASAAGFSRIYGWFAMFLFFNIGYCTRFMIERFWQPDAAAIFILSCCLIAAIKKRPVLFMCLLAVGVFFKENVLFAAPLYYTLNTERLIDLKFLLKSVLLVIPAAACLVLLRFSIPALNANPDYIASLPKELWQVQLERPDYDLPALVREIASMRIERMSFLYLLAAYFLPFGALAGLLPFLAMRRNVYWVIRLSPFFLILVAHLLFAVETTRPLVFGAPVMILLATEGGRSFSRFLRLPAYYILPLPLIIAFIGLSNPARSTVKLTTQLLIIILYYFTAVLVRRLIMRTDRLNNRSVG